MVVRIIAHRGNLHGAVPERENAPDYLEAAVASGVDVEADVWWSKGAWWFGHDAPQYRVGDKLPWGTEYWFHAKNIDAVRGLIGENRRWFWHESDHFALTSDGIAWVFPGRKPPPMRSILVLSGKEKPPPDVWGVCTDFPLQQYLSAGRRCSACIGGDFAPNGVSDAEVCNLCGAPCSVGRAPRPYRRVRP